MHLFGFELRGIQVLQVVCPHCKEPANVMFVPPPGDKPIPFPGDVAEAIKPLGLGTILTVPDHDDLHFFCMNCWRILKSCEVNKTPCRIERKPP